MVRLTSKSEVKKFAEDAAGSKCPAFKRMMMITKLPINPKSKKQIFVFWI